MKKAISLILFFLILFPMIVKAEDCGGYSFSYKDSSWSWVGTVQTDLETDTYAITINDSSARVIVNNNSSHRNSGNIYKFSNSCPETVYICGTDSTYLGRLYYMTDGATCFGTLKKAAAPVEPDVEIDASDKYKDIQSCKAATYKYIKQCGCMPAALTDLTSRLYMLIKIAAPALLLIVGGFDLVKAMSAQDEKAIKKAQQKLVKKFVAAAAVFLILTIVQFLVSTLSNNTKNTLECLDYLLNGYVA